MEGTSRPVRSYSDAERAKALVALDLYEGNLSKTSRATKIPIATLSDWRNGKVNEDVSTIRMQEKQSLADRFEQLAHLYVSRAVETVEHAKGTQAIVGAATATDKMRLLREQSTVITTPQIEPTAIALLNAINQYRDFCQQNNLAFPTNEQLIERINQVASERNIDAKLLQERVLGSPKETT